MKDCYSILNEETSYILEFFGVKIPNDIKIKDNEDVLNTATFKNKTSKCLKYLEDNNAKESQISNISYSWYWSIVGCTFSSPTNKYDPKMSYYASIATKYCNEKQLERIYNDIEKTIAALDKMKDNGKELSKLQMDYYKDIKANMNKFKK